MHQHDSISPCHPDSGWAASRIPNNVLVVVLDTLDSGVFSMLATLGGCPRRIHIMAVACQDSFCDFAMMWHRTVWGTILSMHQHKNQELHCWCIHQQSGVLFTSEFNEFVHPNSVPEGLRWSILLGLPPQWVVQLRPTTMASGNLADWTNRTW